MSADAKKSEYTLNKLEIWLGIIVPILVMLAFAGWAQMQSPDRHILSDGAAEVRENSFAMITGIVLSLSMVTFGVAVLWRRHWRLAPAGIVSIFIGIMIGALMVSRMAVSGVMMFTATDVTVSAPAWLGGETRAKLVYSQMDCLGTRKRIRWEREWHPVSYVVRWMMAVKPGWRRVVDDEYFVKMKTGEETQVDLGLTVKGAWDEILKAARSAGVTVKPVERIILSKPTD